MIELKNLSKKYGNQYALENVSLVLKNGVYGLLGINGAGKTTLINLIMGITKADSGQIYLDGKECSTLGAGFLGKIGYLPQYPQFYKEFEVYEFMDYMCALKGVQKKQSRDRIEYLLTEVNLIDSRHKKIGALSGGMRQRLGIAQAMINFPRILVLDEPTAGLDPQERIRFRNLISRFSEDRIVLLATHIVSDVEFTANKVVILNHGTIVKQGTIQELENSISGKVWEFFCENTTVYEKIRPDRIINMKRDENGIIFRTFSEECPEKGAVLVHANLDDVFLYYCRGNQT